MKFYYLVPGIICCLLWNFSFVMSFVEEDFLDNFLPEGYDDIVPQAKQLIKLLEQESPAKGRPFPKIIGPKPDDQVCIVGAGPAGIHMAVSLRSKGYKHIKIYEKSYRVGGKSFDTDSEYKGAYRFQGTIFLNADYHKNIVALANRYNITTYNDLVDIGATGVSCCYLFPSMPITTKFLQP